MKQIVEHALYGRIEYNENIWTGKRDITINGVRLTKAKKNVYVYDTGEAKINVSVQGNVYTGINLAVGEETIEVERKSAWYELACSISIFVIVLIWGNSTYLCSIVPIIGGAIGGAVSGLMGILNLRAMKTIKNVGVKLAVWFAMLVATLVICFILAIIYLLAIM